MITCAPLIIAAPFTQGSILSQSITALFYMLAEMNDVFEITTGLRRLLCINHRRFFEERIFDKAENQSAKFYHRGLQLISIDFGIRTLNSPFRARQCQVCIQPFGSLFYFRN